MVVLSYLFEQIAVAEGKNLQFKFEKALTVDEKKFDLSHITYYYRATC